MSDRDAKLCRNIRYALKAVKHRLVLPKPAHADKAAIVCYGPSLADTFGAIDQTATVATVSAAHDYCMERGLVPGAHVEFDARAHKAKHVRFAHHDTVYMLASCVHPDMIDRLSGMSVTLWHAMNFGEADTMIREAEPSAYLVEGGSSVGLRAIELLYALGFRAFDIHGMDSSFRDDGRTQWAGKHFGTSADKRDVVDVIAYGRSFKSSLAFIEYSKQFVYCRRKLNDATFTLHGDGLLQHIAAAQMKEVAA